MSKTQPRAKTQDPAALSPGEMFLEALGLKRELPRTLLVKANGQIFQERQIGFLGNGGGQGNPLQSLDYLMREDAIGGAEPIVRENKALLLEKFNASLGQRLAEADEASPAPQFLAEIVETGEKFKREHDAQLSQLRERYTQTQARLKKWQDDYGREKNIVTRVVALGSALFGGNVSLSEAGQLWNRRELLHKNREAWRAATEVWATVIQTAGGYARNLDALKLTAYQAIQQAQLDRARLENELANAHPWTYAVDYLRLAEEWRASDSDPVLLAQLLTLARTEGTETFAAQTAEVAHREMDRWLSKSNLPELIEMEARATLNGDAGDPQVDPLILVAETLSDQVRWQLPTWQLIRQARPRKLTLQITPSGEPLFEHASLSTARYGERNDRLGFLDAELDVALDELRFVAEGRDQFRQARLGREYFILEDVISELVPGTSFGTEPSSPAAEASTLSGIGSASSPLNQTVPTSTGIQHNGGDPDAA